MNELVKRLRGLGAKVRARRRKLVCGERNYVTVCGVVWEDWLNIAEPLVRKHFPNMRITSIINKLVGYDITVTLEAVTKGERDD